jgi:hypothetical protein
MQASRLYDRRQPGVCPADQGTAGAASLGTCCNWNETTVQVMDELARQNAALASYQ